MKKIGLILTAFLITCEAFANAAIKYSPTDHFESGSELYTQWVMADPSAPIWKTLLVPVDYQNPNSVKVPISYTLGPGFSADKPTVIYFNGGPGGSSVDTNFSHVIKDVNFIYFNQRGIFFSRPETEEMFLNPDFYSSENIARDGFELVKSLNVQQVTVYGHSYGTIPATIFAHLFPSTTRSVILEGTIFSGDTALWNAPHRIKILQKFFDKLPVETQNLILKFSRPEFGAPAWFAKLAQTTMYGQDYEDRVLKTIHNFLYTTNVDNTQTLKSEAEIMTVIQMFDPSAEKTITDFGTFGAVMFNMIACKELGASNPASNMSAIFNGRKLTAYAIPSNFCNLLNVPVAQRKIYHSVDYPITKPVYYFQGTKDGATTADFAINHYKLTAKGSATLLLAKNSGHLPVIETLMLNLNQLETADSGHTTAIKDLFTKAVLAQIITATDLAALNAYKAGEIPVQWVKTSK